MEKVCNYFGTINDTHHSAACVDEQRKNNLDWHESHKQAIKEKWVQTPQQERRERIATAIMAGIYANPAHADISEKMAALCAIDGMEALINALDEVKE